MKNVIKGLTCLFLGCIMVCFFTVSASAEGTDTYSLTIVKYRLEGDATFHDSLPHDGTKVDAVTDADGNTLTGFANVTYRLTRVMLKDSGLDETKATSYTAAAGDEAFTMELVTNSNGHAVINGLPKGVYLVEELPNELLIEVMDPVLVHLPMQTEDGLLTHVYLYPKSSIVLPDDPITDPKEDGNNATGSNSSSTGSNGKLPQTSGNIGTVHQMVWMMGMIAVMGTAGLLISKQRKRVQ